MSRPFARYFRMSVGRSSNQYCVGGVARVKRSSSVVSGDLGVQARRAGVVRGRRPTIESGGGQRSFGSRPATRHAESEQLASNFPRLRQCGCQATDRFGWQSAIGRSSAARVRSGLAENTYAPMHDERSPTPAPHAPLLHEGSQKRWAQISATKHWHAKAPRGHNRWLSTCSVCVYMCVRLRFRIRPWVASGRIEQERRHQTRTLLVPHRSEFVVSPLRRTHPFGTLGHIAFGWVGRFWEKRTPGHDVGPPGRVHPTICLRAGSFSVLRCWPNSTTRLRLWLCMQKRDPRTRVLKAASYQHVTCSWMGQGHATLATDGAVHL